MRTVETGLRGPPAHGVVEEALSKAATRRVLAACVKAPQSVKDISREVDLPLASTYRHVNALLEAGLLIIERSAMTPDGKRYDLYRSRLRAARIEMDPSGERVTWELNEPVETRLVSMWDALRFQGRKP